MRASTIFSVATLFLIGSYSLPQPENLEATRTIETREAKKPKGDPVAGYDEEWHTRYNKDGGGSPGSNGTKIKEREAHRERPSNIPEPEHFGDYSEYLHRPSTAPSTNSTKIKERQGPPEHFGPPDGMSWEEFRKHFKNKKPGSGSVTTDGTNPASSDTSTTTTADDSTTSDLSTSTNSTKVRLVKFRE